MSAVIEATELADAVSWAARALPDRPTHPSMGGIVLEIDGGFLSTRAYDYTTQAAAAANAGGTIEAILVAGKLFAQVTANLHGRVNLDIEGTRLRIRAGREKYSMPLMPMDEYPETPFAPEPEAEVGGFDKAVARIAVAVGIEGAAKPELCGVFMGAYGGKLVLSATDSYRMAHTVLDWDGEDHVQQIIPAKPLKALSAQLGDKPAIGFEAQRYPGISLTAGTRQAGIGVIDGAVLDLETRYINRALAKFDGHVDVERDLLVDAVRKAGLFAEKNKPVILDLSEDAIAVSAAGVGDGDGVVLIDAAYNGPERRVAFFPHFLLDALTTNPGAHLRMQLFDRDIEAGAVIFRAVPDFGGDVDATHTHLIQSLRILGA